ncbi:MAG: leucine-rich repeat protein [Lachnospiraceae bacterium]|nr:leucine-rich repeat protein [Lachnospiraceae bacterium]
MNELEDRIEKLEMKVKILEETLDTLQNMQLSERMEEYIQSRARDLRIVELVNSVSDNSSLDLRKEEESVKKILKQKKDIERQNNEIIKKAEKFSEQYETDSRMFEYEMESGLVTDYYGKKILDNDLLPYVGKGLRITSYNGFNSDKVVIPREIDGYPVISIGEEAFFHATFSAIFIPNTVKAILRRAFGDCQNLKYIDLPNKLEHFGNLCFYNCGFESFRVPDSIKKIPGSCFCCCKKLKDIAFGNQIETFGHGAFKVCQSMKKIFLPDTLKTIESNCFSLTAIELLVLPEQLESISADALTVTCVFLGIDTEIDNGENEKDSFSKVGMIYCLSGSNAQKFAKKYRIPMKPLNEFKAEEYGL